MLSKLVNLIISKVINAWQHLNSTGCIYQFYKLIVSVVCSAKNIYMSVSLALFGTVLLCQSI